MIVMNKLCVIVQNDYLVNQVMFGKGLIKPGMPGS